MGSGNPVMQSLFHKLPPNLVLFILVMAWIVPLLIAGIVGFVRLRRVYRGLQMPVYPGRGKGELFDWAPGPKTPSAAKYSFIGSLLYPLFLTWLLFRMRFSDDPALYLIGWAAVVGIPIQAYVRWRKLARKIPLSQDSFQLSGGPR